jgi:hypothetical protein
MKAQPIRLLLCGYGISAVASLSLQLTSAGIVATVAVFWLGGAAAVVALAVLATRRRDAVDADEASHDAERWEADRRADAASAPDRQIAL